MITSMYYYYCYYLYFAFISSLKSLIPRDWEDGSLDKSTSISWGPEFKSIALMWKCLVWILPAEMSVHNPSFKGRVTSTGVWLWVSPSYPTVNVDYFLEWRGVGRVECIFLFLSPCLSWWTDSCVWWLCLAHIPGFHFSLGLRLTTEPVNNCLCVGSHPDHLVPEKVTCLLLAPVTLCSRLTRGWLRRVSWDPRRENSVPMTVVP